jgi:hypothetical protein
MNKKRRSKCRLFEIIIHIQLTAEMGLPRALSVLAHALRWVFLLIRFQWRPVESAPPCVLYALIHPYSSFHHRDQSRCTANVLVLSCKYCTAGNWTATRSLGASSLQQTASQMLLGSSLSILKEIKKVSVNKALISIGK